MRAPSPVLRMCFAVVAAIGAASAALAGGARVIAAPVIGCTDRGLLARAVPIMSDPRLDYDALMRAALDAGLCRTLEPGRIVVRQGSDWFSGLVRVRPVGEPQAVWISRAALADGVVPFPAAAGTRFPAWR